MAGTLQRYILSEVVKTFLACVAVFMALLFLINTYRWTRDELELMFIVKVLPYYIPYFLILSFPLSFLAATIMTCSRLAATNEITAMYASGVGLWRVCYVPLLLFALFISGICFFFNERIIPYMAQSYQTAGTEIILDIYRRSLENTPRGMPIEHDFGNSKVVLYAAGEDGRRKINITTFGPNRSVKREIEGRHGKIVVEPVNKRLHIFISHGESTEYFPGGVEQRMTFEQAPVVLTLKDLSRELFGAYRTMSLEQLQTSYLYYSREVAGVEDFLKQLKEYNSIPRMNPAPCGVDTGFAAASMSMVSETLVGPTEIYLKRCRNEGMMSSLQEIHSKIGQCLTVIIFVLLGIPLGLKTPSQHRLVGLAAAAGVVLVVYYPMEMLGRYLTSREILQASIGMYLSLATTSLVAAGVTLWKRRA